MSTRVKAEEIKRVAAQSKLTLTEAELERYVNDLNAIVGYAQKLQQVDVSGIEPMTSPIIGQHTPFREDIVGESLTQEEALKGSKFVEAGHFKVPKTIEEH